MVPKFVIACAPAGAAGFSFAKTGPAMKLRAAANKTKDFMKVFPKSGWRLERSGSGGPQDYPKTAFPYRAEVEYLPWPISSFRLGLGPI